MGYRLDINEIKNDKIENRYYGTKLYGYDLELDTSLSYNFLKVIHKFNGEEIFDYCFYNKVILNYEELKLFLLLYNIDYNKGEWCQEKDTFIIQEEIKDILINVGKYEDSDFIIGWC